MKIERTKNAGRNMVFGILLKIYQIAVPFLMRTAMIYFMGVQYLGLNSLFTSILQVLNLAELGVGSAMVYSMYKPIAEDDEITICALMRLYRLYYRIIGLVIAVIGLLLTPFIPKLISSGLPPELNVYILYLLNLAVTVLSYWLFAYKNSLLQAHQRTDVTSKVTLATNTIQYGLQFFVLVTIKNYYIYVLVALGTQALTNIVTAIVATKMYPDYHPIGALSKAKVCDINHRICDLFTSKLGSVIVNSADTIVISAFLGLNSLAIYQNYYFIMNSICGFINIMFSAITAGIGNSLIVESNEKNYNDFKKFTFITCFILCIGCCCFAGLYQPFMKLWVGEELMLDFSFVILFCILFYCLELSMVWATVKDAAGMWHTDRFRPLIGASANLAMNILLVQTIGLYGIILSTIISYILISMPWLVHNLFKYLYRNSMVAYLKDLMKYIFVATFSTLVTIIICEKITVAGILGFLIKGIVSISIPLAIEVFVFRNKLEMRESVLLMKRMLKRG